MSEFTPGPWRKGDVGELMLKNKYREIISDDRKIGLVYGIIDQDNNANANLIAAAPEMYAALEMVLNQSWDGPIDAEHYARKQAAAALAKARGE